MTDTVKVKVVKAKHDYVWYADKIGEVFEVVAKPEHFDWSGDTIYRLAPYGNGFHAEDVEIVPAKPRLYKHEGVDYELPEWAKFVTCDGEGEELWAWESKPKHIDHVGFGAVLTGKRGKLFPYVKPLPQGAFIVEV